MASIDFDSWLENYGPTNAREAEDLQRVARSEKQSGDYSSSMNDYGARFIRWRGKQVLPLVTGRAQKTFISILDPYTKPRFWREGGVVRTVFPEPEATLERFFEDDDGDQPAQNNSKVAATKPEATLERFFQD